MIRRFLFQETQAVNRLRQVGEITLYGRSLDLCFQSGSWKRSWPERESNPRHEDFQSCCYLIFICLFISEAYINWLLRRLHPSIFGCLAVAYSDLVACWLPTGGSPDTPGEGQYIRLP